MPFARKIMTVMPHDQSNYELPEGLHLDGKTLVIHNEVKASGGRWWVRILLFVFGFSMLLNLMLMATVGNLVTETSDFSEKLVEGDLLTTDKIALIEVSGTIMPPMTERILKVIEHAEEDDNVKAALLVVDSPGGVVADSHQIYHALTELQKAKPVYVQMKRLAASGGYYISMGIGPKGKIFAEPTTWTGSIGVILPQYDASELAEKVGVKSNSLTTGPLKDALNPLNPATDLEIETWQAIIDEAFDLFVEVIDSGRENLNPEQIREIATGQVYTAKQALSNGLIDEISFQEQTLQTLKSDFQLGEVKVVRYEFPVTFNDLFLGVTAPKQQSIQQILSPGIPQAMYLFSREGFPALPIPSAY